MNDPGHIEGVNTTTLMIVNVTVTDWGMYSCEASNIVNNVTSNGATLHGECERTTIWSIRFCNFSSRPTCSYV